MAGHAERGISAPPEVVFNTATDPDRAAAWLPAPLHERGERHPDPDRTDGGLYVRWSSPASPGWLLELIVTPQDSGGAWVRLDVSTGERANAGQLTELAERSLASLAGEVAENLTAG